jgi:GTP 3',8-cyclase
MLVDNMRISVTQDCNLDCQYCHKEGECSPAKEVSLEKIRQITDSAIKLGIKKFKITGGEPLLRKDIVEIIYTIKQLGAEDISMTTNGTLLGSKAKALKQAGLNRVNIGCDSLSSSILEKTKDSIKNGLNEAKQAGLNPIKLNMVVLKGINENEIEDMIEFARETKTILQLIELIDKNNQYFKNHYFPLDKIEADLKEKALAVNKRNMQNRLQYDLGNVLVEVIRPTHKSFCAACNKIRITSDGLLKPCLMRDDNLINFENSDSLKQAISAKGAYYD